MPLVKIRLSWSSVLCLGCEIWISWMGRGGNGRSGFGWVSPTIPKNTGTKWPKFTPQISPQNSPEMSQFASKWSQNYPPKWTKFSQNSPQNSLQGFPKFTLKFTPKFTQIDLEIIPKLFQNHAKTGQNSLQVHLGELWGEFWPFFGDNLEIILRWIG